MNFFRKCALLTACLAVAVCADAQILYKVEAPGSSRPSFILGTHHFAPLAVVEKLPHIDDIILLSNRVYGEVDMQGMNSPEVIMKMQGAMMAPADSTLDKLLIPAQLDSVAKAFSGLSGQQIPAQALSPLKPAAISTQLAQLITMKALPQINPMEGIDNTMQTKARAAGKTVAGLETIDFQIDMLFNTPLSSQADALMRTVRDLEGETRTSRELSSAYIAHDIDKILELMLKTEAEDPSTAERLIYSRNLAWAQRLKNEIPREPLYIVVGAGHLPGPRGLLEELRHEGFTVTPLQ